MNMDRKKSAEGFDRISRHLPGAVNSVARKNEPLIVFSWASGARIRDLDGNEYLDYHAAAGPIILGHRHPYVEKKVDELRDTMDLICAGTTEVEGRVCDEISNCLPSAEKVHLCSTGSEATLHAIRLARGASKRRRIVKFEGCYHGWHDYISNTVDSYEQRGLDPLAVGILPEAATYTSTLTYNSIEELENHVAEHRGEIACIIIEPIAHNMGCIPCSKDFLKALRQICDKEDIVLIFDEIISGFRHSLGGYQSIVGITPDLTTFGKAVANGYPLSGLGGRSDIMNQYSTAGGRVQYGGTYYGHPYSCAAALATIESLRNGDIYERLFRLGKMVSSGIDAVAQELGIEAHTAFFGSVFATYFAKPPITNYKDIMRNNDGANLSFLRGMIDKGIFMLPATAKRNYITASHTDEDIKETIETSRQVLSDIRMKVAAT